MDNKQKILICGDVNGKFKQLFNRVETINKKSGPFELLLCMGNFFDQNSANEELEAYRNGNKQVTVPTYILGPNSELNSKEYGEIKEDGEICTNLTYLGKRGLYTVASGLKIAYVSGVECGKGETKSDWTFDKEEVIAVRNLCFSSKTSSNEYRGIDILITSQWPQNIQDEKLEESSLLLSWLAAEIKPRYHFSALKGLSFERKPYRNPVGSNTQLELASRFIALSEVGNREKSKYIYALSIAPVDKMKLMDLIQKTTTETSSPYEHLDLMKDNSAGAQSNKNSSQYFYDTNSFDGNDRKRKGFGYEGGEQRKKPKQIFDQEKCWFCLSSSSVEKHLVITIGDNFYMTLAKGPIDEYHVLLLSVTHIQSTSLLSADDWKELNKFKEALRQYFKTQNKVVSFFERNYKSSHLQINAIAVDADIEWQIKPSFNDKADEYNMQLEELPAITEATQLPEKGPYFVAELPNGDALLTRQMKMFPLHFGREVFCAESLLNCEAKVDWKECSLSKEEEVRLVKKFRDGYKPFDFTLK